MNWISICLAEGKHEHIYEKLGAHVVTHDGVKGVSFAVWAPNAAQVSVVGNFNGWDGSRHPMRSLGQSGVWEVFIPGLTAGELYKYEIKSPGLPVFQKADPYASYARNRRTLRRLFTNLTIAFAIRVDETAGKGGTLSPVRSRSMKFTSARGGGGGRRQPAVDLSRNGASRWPTMFARWVSRMLSFCR